MHCLPFKKRMSLSLRSTLSPVLLGSPNSSSGSSLCKISTVTGNLRQKIRTISVLSQFLRIRIQL
jgi:hypothetical protein